MSKDKNGNNVEIFGKELEDKDVYIPMKYRILSVVNSDDVTKKAFSLDIQTINHKENEQLLSIVFKEKDIISLAISIMEEFPEIFNVKT